MLFKGLNLIKPNWMFDLFSQTQWNPSYTIRFDRLSSVFFFCESHNRGAIHRGHPAMPRKPGEPLRTERTRSFWRCCIAGETFPFACVVVSKVVFSTSSVMLPHSSSSHAKVTMLFRGISLGAPFSRSTGLSVLSAGSLALLGSPVPLMVFRKATDPVLISFGRCS